MESKRGISKIAIVFIVLITVLIIIGGTILTIWLIDKNSNNTPVEVDLYEDYVEGEGFVTDEDMAGAQMTPLAAGLKEYRNDELGIRFGYLDELEIPEDSEEEDGTYVSVMKSNSSEKSVMFRVGKIDVSQTDIDHIQKQKEALTKELIKAETYTVEEEVNGEKVTKTIVPEKVSDISTSYSIFAGQLAVRFSYTEKGLKCTRILTIQDGLVFSLTYKANEDNYNTTEESKMFNSFEFIQKIDDVENSELNTVIIDDVDYSLPIKQTKIEGLIVDTKYSTQRIQPNYFTIVSLYNEQQPKYSAYIYNAKASLGMIGDGYVTAISTDVSRGGNLKIYKGIEIGTTYSKVKELLGSPSRQYTSSDDLTLTNIYQIEGVTIQLKFRNDNMEGKPNDNSKVVAISIKVAR